MVRFAGIQKTSLIDFPDRISTVLFTPGCNLRCPYCYNWRIVLEPKGPYLSEKEALNILRLRRRFINSVVISGGEPTIHPSIKFFLKKLKDEGFKVKLDTNGFFPETLKECMPYIDYVALDVKTAASKYRLLGADNIDGYLETIDVLKRGKIDYEFRMTVVPEIVEEEDLHDIGEMIRGAKRLALQQFIPGDTLDKRFSKIKPYSEKTITRFADRLREYVDEVILRV